MALPYGVASNVNAEVSDNIHLKGSENEKYNVTAHPMATLTNSWPRSRERSKWDDVGCANSTHLQSQ